MTGGLDMRILELLMARLCHDLAGPIAAVGHGAEVLADDENIMGEAVRLVADAATRAAHRLRFYRFAYGFGGDRTATVGAPAELAVHFFEATTISCDYAAAARRLPLAWQKLACNLLLVGVDLLPRGGRLAVDGSSRGLVLDAAGAAVALAPELTAALTLALPTTALTPATVQAYFAGLLAGMLGCRLLAVNAAAAKAIRIDAVAAGYAATDP
jgi:histidine phosphotransferase ChpT